MKLSNIIKIIEDEIPKNLAIENDFIGLMDSYNLNQEINNVYIVMNLYPEDISKFKEDDLIITHHKPLFIPKIPTYVLHSNWDVIKGGANEALAEKFNLKVVEIFDEELGIGRICKYNGNLNEFLKTIEDEFPFAQIVGNPKKYDRIAIISGFGLKNPNYIKLANKKNIDILISGDLTQETAVLAKNLDVCLINIDHHYSEVPGLYKLKELLNKNEIHSEIIEKSPWKNLNEVLLTKIEDVKNEELYDILNKIERDEITDELMERLLEVVENADFLVPVINIDGEKFGIDEDIFTPISIDDEEKEYVPLFTDLTEYEKGMELLGQKEKYSLKILKIDYFKDFSFDDDVGISINIATQNVFLGIHFLSALWGVEFEEELFDFFDDGNLSEEEAKETLEEMKKEFEKTNDIYVFLAPELIENNQVDEHIDQALAEKRTLENITGLIFDKKADIFKDFKPKNEQEEKIFEFVNYVINCMENIDDLEDIL